MPRESNHTDIMSHRDGIIDFAESATRFDNPGDGIFDEERVQRAKRGKRLELIARLSMARRWDKEHPENGESDGDTGGTDSACAGLRGEGGGKATELTGDDIPAGPSGCESHDDSLCGGLGFSPDAGAVPSDASGVDEEDVDEPVCEYCLGDGEGPPTYWGFTPPCPRCKGTGRLQPELDDTPHGDWRKDA